MISYLGSSTSLCTHFINKNPGFRNQNFDLQNAKFTFGEDKIKSNEAPNRSLFSPSDFATIPCTCVANTPQFPYLCISVPLRTKKPTPYSDDGPQRYVLSS